jgi:hypothetical protein
MKNGLWSLFILFSVGCGLRDDQTSPQPVDPVVWTIGQPLQQDGASWVGTGHLRMGTDLRSPRETLHILLEGFLFEKDSKLVLHLFYDNFFFDTGLRLALSPRFPGEALEGTEGHHHTSMREAQIVVEIAEPGQSYRELAVIENALTNQGLFRFRVEAINRLNSDRQLLVWNDSLVLDSGARDVRDAIVAGSADYNSWHSGDILFDWGQGLSWGISLEKARVDILKREAPYVDR